jgi:alpha-tubulin suppressor-like RCC1 family protein
MLSARSHTTCALQQGRAICWGPGGGSGEAGTWSVPRFIEETANLVDIAVGDTFTCGLDTAGAVLCWGQNDQGQLGVGDLDARSTPTPSALAEPIASLSAGALHVCAITRGGALWCWGDNAENQLGLDDGAMTQDRASPIRVGTDADWESVAAGFGHSCGLRHGGALYCWGRNAQSQQGLGPDAPLQTGSPTFVDPGPWRAISAGLRYSCGIKRDGTLWCWGDNNESQLGTGDRGAVHTTPAQVGRSNDWRFISVQTFSSCAVNADDNLFCWGRNVEGQLGVGDTEYRNEPVMVEPALRFTAVAAGSLHTCAQPLGATIYCSGANEEGQLGNGTTERTTLLGPCAPVSR